MSNTVDNSKSNVVDEFYKNSGEQEKYVISINHFQGNQYIDMRLFYLPGGEDEFKPTRKGLSISVEHLDKLRDALKKVKNTVER